MGTQVKSRDFHQQQQQQQREPVHVGSDQLMASPMTELIKSLWLILERQAESVSSVHQLMAKSAARGANLLSSLLALAVTPLSFPPLSNLLAGEKKPYSPIFFLPRYRN